MVRGPSLTEETASSGDGTQAQPAATSGARHSGKLLVRMPATLHDELARVAKAEGVSLNQLITGVLASSVGWRGNGEVQEIARPDRDGDAPTAEPSLSPRLTRAALVANLVVLVLAAGVAIALLVAAWQAGL